MTESNDIAYRTRKFINSYYNEASLVLEAIDETVDQEILIELTKPGYYSSYRVKAIKYIDGDSKENQELFIKLAKEDIASEVRAAAIARINVDDEDNQSLFIDLVKKGNKSAIDKLNTDSTNNQLFFIDRAKKGDIKAVQKITSENILAEIAYNTTKEDIFQEAITRIHDEEILADIGYNFPESEICGYIVDRISDQEVLTEIIKQNRSYDICYKAFKKITDASFFYQIATECKFYQLRAASLKGINDETILKSIFKNDENGYVRLCALEKCKSEELLTSIIIDDFWDDFIISEYAIDNINDKSILNQKFKEGDIYSQKILLPKIKDKSLLADIAYNHEDNEIREIALNSLMGTAEKDPEDELDVKIKMYIDILEDNLNYYPEHMIFFSHIEDNCIYLKLRVYEDPLYIDSLDNQDLSWDSHKVNDFESKFRPLDFKYDVWINIEYEKRN